MICTICKEKMGEGYPVIICSCVNPNDTSTFSSEPTRYFHYSCFNRLIEVQDDEFTVSIQDPPRERPFPWPLPYSATQGAVGGAGGVGMVSVQPPPYYGPFQPYWPYGVPQQWFNGLPTPSVRF